MDESDRPNVLPTIIVGGIVVVAALTVIGWVIGAVLALARVAVIVAIVVAVIWAIASARADR